MASGNLHEYATRHLDPLRYRRHGAGTLRSIASAAGGLNWRSWEWRDEIEISDNSRIKPARLGLQSGYKNGLMIQVTVG